MIKYKRIGIFVGHSLLSTGNYTSADGRSRGGLLEYTVCKDVSAEVSKWLTSVGQANDVIIVPERQYSSNNEYNYKLPIANSGKYDLIIELHCNAHDSTTANGTEMLYLSNSGKAVADRLQAKMNTVFTNRGVKLRNDLYMLTRTNPVSVMPELFFCTTVADCNKYNQKGAKEIGRLLAEGLLNTTIRDTAPSTTSGFRVVCGSFPSVADANNRMQILASKGISCFTSVYNINGINYNRVICGFYTNRTNAEARISEIKSKTGLDSFLVAHTQ